MLRRFVENAALESAAQELIQQAHMMANEKHFNALHLKIKIQIVVQCLIRNQNRCFIYLVAFLSSYHEKATERCTSLLWSCRPCIQVLFPRTAERGAEGVTVWGPGDTGGPGVLNCQV